MNDRQIDELLTAANPITPDVVADLDLVGVDRLLKEHIMSTPVLVRPGPDSATPAPQRRRSVVRWVAAAAVAAVVAAVVVVTPFGNNDDSAWAAEALAVANATSRLLVDLPGWEVTRAHTFTVEEGEMTFGDGTFELDLHWRPSADHPGYVADREASAEAVRSVTVAGHAAVQVQYIDSLDFTSLWLADGHSYEVRGVFPDRAAYEAVVAALTPTDVDTWLLAMPDTVVKPDARAAAVDEMLADMPLPQDFDRTALRSSADVSDRYQLGAAVAGAVACGWIEQWLDARDAGNAAAEAAALRAMQTSRDWSILLEMQAEGAYPQVLWLHVDTMEAGGTAPEPIGIDNYRQALGC